ncbi:mannitol dehydrogenase family protein [Salinicola avicenniae]|uniref:mannitol dehydrogenase family protein n=1 Tax=Salinicola avicenniae TaxID=2916836 RepID=UPI00207392D2|nr:MULTISPECIES: mannitol dehydrogenase family protein [unclassified Salinicola]
MSTVDVTLDRQPSRHTPARIGIVHLGLGAFHRAHQAVYLQQHLNRCVMASGEKSTDPAMTGSETEVALSPDDWGITSANIRANRTLVDQLQTNGMRYHVVEYQDSTHATLREITAIREALFAGPGGADREALLARLSHPDVRIVTLTVTEKGYFLNPASGELLTDAEPIAHDIAEPSAPFTAPGLLVAALARRRVAGIAPFTVLCCDNMPENGKRTRQAIVSLAAQHDKALADWIAEAVAFPSSMVDRIVPAMTEDDHERLRRLGIDDPAAVICEAFRQWVIEDNFPLGRPDWAADGVEMVDDVTPFETMKLRLLNGAHSLLAYAGALAGIETVDAAVSRPAFRRLLARYWQDEAIPTLTLPPQADADAYTASLLARFANDSLGHRLIQIAMDGSQKLPQRWLAGAVEQHRTGDDLRATALGVAAWIRFTAGTNLAGQPLTVSDPMADTCAALHRRHTGNPAALVSAFLALDAIFPAALRDHPGFSQAVTGSLQQIEREGIERTIDAHFHAATRES